LNEFLILTRLEETAFQLKLEEFSLHALLTEITEDFIQLKKPGQSIHLICSTDEPFMIRSDKTCLKHIMNNLISNAIKFSDEKSKIDITLNQKDDKFVIIVADNGIGIPEDEQKFIFDIFYRASNVLNVQGTGLGLNIVKKYLDAIKGEILFESKEGKGTKITIQLPKG
jgi:signal transduction histidine kinase